MLPVSGILRSLLDTVVASGSTPSPDDFLFPPSLSHTISSVKTKLIALVVPWL